MRNMFVAGILSVFFTGALSSGEVEYDIVLLAPAGYEINTETKAMDLSESGFVVGQVSDYPRWPVTKGFIYHPATGFQVISGALGNGDVYPRFINDQGTVLGEAGVNEWEIGDSSASLSGGSAPFIYKAGSAAFESLGEQYGYGIGISGSGKVLLIDNANWNEGWAVVLYDPESQERKEIGLADEAYMNNAGDIVTNTAFYPAEGGKINLGTLDAYGRWPVEVYALSDSGLVAGYGKDTQKDTKGFVWDKACGFRQINTLGQGKLAISTVNNDGNVVGYSKTALGMMHAFLYEPRVGTVDLKTLGGQASYALDLNDALQVVGTADSAPSDLKKSERRAFIWDAAHGMRDLNDLVPQNTGWKKLSKAEKINNRGYIIGSGIYLGQKHAFLLIPRGE